jgi:hypothetical protein
VPLDLRCSTLATSHSSGGRFTEGFDTRDLKEAKTLLEGLAE